MSQTELDRLAAEERELEAKLASIRVAKEQQKRAIEAAKLEEERTKPVTVQVLAVVGMQLKVKAPYREDLVKVWRETEGRTWNGESNMIPLGSWEKCKEELLWLENVDIEYSSGVQELIAKRTNQPKYLVELLPGNEGLLVSAGYGETLWYVTQELQWKWSPHNTNEEPKVIIPVSEAWRLPEAFTKKSTVYNRTTYKYDEIKTPIEGVVYTPEAAKLIEQQIENKHKLDLVAKLPEAPWIRDELTAKGFKNAELVHNFQCVGLEFGKLANFRFINSDEVGLGKSLQAIGASLLMDSKQTLFVVPASLIRNWVRQLTLWTDTTEEQILILKGSDPRNWILEFIRKPKYVIVSCDTLGRKVDKIEITQREHEGDKWETSEEIETYPVVDFLKMVGFDMIVFDEAHYLKNHSSNRSKAAIRFAVNTKARGLMCMTGHPIVNKAKELHPLLNMVNPGQWGSLEKYEERYTDANGDPKNMEELHKSINHIFIRRKKVDIFKELPPVVRVNQFHTLSEKARKIYKKAEDGLYKALAMYNAEGEEGESENVIMHYLAKITRMKQICAADTVERTADQAQEIWDSTGEKVIIFTQYKGVAYRIAQMLQPHARCFVSKKKKEGARIAHFETANPEARDAMIQEFQNDPDVHFLVATLAGEHGHTITAAKHMIFNDLFWTPKAHEQCEGRAHGRLNDMHGLDAHYIICENTVSELIMGILEKKLAVFNKVIEGADEARIKDGSIGKELLKAIKKQMWIRQGKESEV